MNIHLAYLLMLANSISSIVSNLAHGILQLQKIPWVFLVLLANTNNTDKVPGK